MPGVPEKAAGLFCWNYVEEAGAGAVLAGAALGQQEAARKEAAAATMSSLTIFMMILMVGCKKTSRNLREHRPHASRSVKSGKL